MFGWLKRLFRIGKAEANAVLDKIGRSIENDGSRNQEPQKGS